MNLSGKEFQTFGSMTEKALSPVTTNIASGGGATKAGVNEQIHMREAEKAVLKVCGFQAIQGYKGQYEHIELSLEMY